MNITVYCGSQFGADPIYQEKAKELGQWIGTNGHTLIYGGGKIGLMGAVADAVLAEGGTVIGVIPEFLKTPDKVHDRLTKLYTVKTMEERKRRMIDLGEAFIALPGGPGTLEEISEIMSLRRLKKCTAPCLIYNVSGYYDPLESMCQRMGRQEFIVSDYEEIVLFPRCLDEIRYYLEEEEG
ncbi:TIGR00730 family Rossman fold protein [uncultured Acidaminococcus sp.]|jgi:uncharacterized protein (TIGR00730 family)|uniref:LOG family protein n=1 Tax=uncultured Acidaminococcus sp. TaxID=352152 RepID=UPI0025DF338B|nr:TIGR00730 family Rossman fold protein [uncultured Acidaminococcus sp.]